MRDRPVLATTGWCSTRGRGQFHDPRHLCDGL